MAGYSAGVPIFILKVKNKAYATYPFSQEAFKLFRELKLLLSEKRKRK